MRKFSYGQSLIEALFVVTFTTIIMFAFLQICIMVIDDMSANEAAFVAMRSASVTMNPKRLDEVNGRVKHYFNYYYYGFSLIQDDGLLSGRGLNLSDKEIVADYYRRNNDNSQHQQESEDEDTGVGNNPEETDQAVTIWPKYSSNSSKYTHDYSGGTLSRRTVKIYYFTRVMFGSLVAKRTSNARGTSDNDKSTKIIDRVAGISGNRRYQSARNRMMVSPDQTFYETAYSGAKKFKNYDTKSLIDKFFGS